MSERNHVTDKQFLGVRQAFRLLDLFQKTINSIVYYVRDCSVYKNEHKNKDNIYAVVWYENVTTRQTVKNRDFAVATVKIYRDDWAWPYLPCYFVEHVLGDESIDVNYCLRFSIFQVSDDGSFVSENNEKYEGDWHFTSDFRPAEESESWLIFSADLYAVDKEPKLWLRKNPQNETKYPDDSQYDFVNEFIINQAEIEYAKTQFARNGELDEVFVIKKYKMTEFSGREGIDAVIKDFAQLMNKASHGKNIFKF